MENLTERKKIIRGKEAEGERRRGGGKGGERGRERYPPVIGANAKSTALEMFEAVASRVTSLSVT
jgi:hypothetical protein